jgi:hypothetical protein
MHSSFYQNKLDCPNNGSSMINLIIPVSSLCEGAIKMIGMIFFFFCSVMVKILMSVRDDVLKHIGISSEIFECTVYIRIRIILWTLQCSEKPYNNGIF